MNNSNTDKSNNEAIDSSLQIENEEAFEKAAKLKKATPNLRKKLRKVAIATALPLLSLISMPQGTVASPSRVDVQILGTTSTYSDSAQDLNSSSNNPESFSQYIYQNAENNFTYILPIYGDSILTDLPFQYELGRYLAPEDFKEITTSDPTEAIRQMKEKINQMNGVLSEFRNQDPEFYVNVQNNYASSFNSFNPNLGRNESHEVKKLDCPRLEK